jgi:lysophospholipase L1-like esterase/peptidoglycan/xylan/chitin deacetylase (PgdA/CDA1 family)
MADFPNAIHTFIDPSGKAARPLSDGHVDAHTELAQELRAVQQALGTNPGGASGSVKQALQDLANNTPSVNATVANGTSLNAIGANGTYAVNSTTITERPTSALGVLQVIVSGTVAIQRFTTVDDPPRVYYRRGLANGSSWQAWAPVVTVANVTSGDANTFVRGTRYTSSSPFTNGPSGMAAGSIETISITGSDGHLVQVANEYSYAGNTSRSWMRRKTTDGGGASTWSEWLAIGGLSATFGQTDLNLAKRNTRVVFNAAFTNGPSGMGAGMVETTSVTGDDNFLLQVAYEWSYDGSTTRIWTRRMTTSAGNSTWSAWREIGGTIPATFGAFDLNNATMNTRNVYNAAFTNGPDGMAAGMVETTTVTGSNGYLLQTAYEWTYNGTAGRIWTRRKTTSGSTPVWSKWYQMGGGSVSQSLEVISHRAWPYLRRGIASGTVRVAAVGDSKTEGTGAGSMEARWQNKLAGFLQSMLPSSGNQGTNVASTYLTFYPMPGAPTRSGNTTQVTNDTGPYARAIRLGPSTGSGVGQVAWTERTGNKIRVNYAKGSSSNLAGTFEVLIDGVVAGEVNAFSATTADGFWAEYSVPLGQHSVTVRLKAGTTDNVQIGAVEWRTSDTGATVYDFGHSGGTASQIAGNDRFWENLASVDPHLVVIAFGSNDMGGGDLDLWTTSINTILTKMRTYCPNAGLVWQFSQMRVDRQDVYEPFASALVSAMATFERGQIVWEGIDFRGAAGTGDGDLLNVWTDETGVVHPNPAGHTVIAEALWSRLVPPSLLFSTAASQASVQDLDARTQPRLLLEVDAPAGLGPLAVGIDGQVMQLDPMSARPLTQSTTDAPSDGLWAVGINGQAVNLLANGGGGSSSLPAVNVPEPATRVALDAKARRLNSAPRRTTKAVVAIVADDYPKSTLDILAPEMASRNLPWSWNVCGGMFDAGFLYSGTHVGTKTWADVTALDPTKVELINHGWSHNDVSDDALMWHEIVESRDRIRTETGREVLGWMPPGVDYPGLKWKSMPLVRFNGGEDNYPTTVAGRLILDHHAWGTCTLARPGDSDNTHPLDGSPRWLCSRGWIDATGDLGVQVGGQGDTSIAAAIARGHGVILSLHAAYIEGGTQAQRISLAGLRAFLDRVKAARDAGDIDVVLMTPWHYSQIGA